MGWGAIKLPSMIKWQKWEGSSLKTENTTIIKVLLKNTGQPQNWFEKLVSKIKTTETEKHQNPQK